MPLGDRQENDLVHITLDVWQDKVTTWGRNTLRAISLLGC